MPEIPAELTERGERARYVAMHFWDTLDFTDRSKSTSEDFMGLNFANFALILSMQADSAAVGDAAAKFMRRAAADPEAFAMAREIAEGYLTERESPMRNAETWLALTDGLRSMEELGSAERERYSYLHSMALKNRTGSPAEDFEYEPRGRKGERKTLYGTPTGSEGLVLLFYDPDCSHCEQTVKDLQGYRLLNSLIDGGKLKVIAIAAETERALWENTADMMPGNWTVGYNTDGIADREAYDLPEMPVIYVLDRDFKVAGKELTEAELISIIEKIED